MEMGYNRLGDEMEKRNIRLGNQNYDCIIERKSIKRFYFRFHHNCFYISAPHLANRNTLEKIILENEAKLIKLTHKKTIDLTTIQSMSLLGRIYSIQRGNISKIEEEVIYIDQNADFMDELYALTLPLLSNYVRLRLPMYHEIMYQNHDVPSVIFRRVKSYYGRYQKNKHQITLNLNLVFLDEELIDYILVHELAHIRYMHHKKVFYQWIETTLPNYRLAIKKIKQGVVFHENYIR